MKLLDPGYSLSLRPWRYERFYNRFTDAVKNTWSVGEVDFAADLQDLRSRMTPAERHMIQRLVAFFATGDTIVANNLVNSFYTHLNAGEARMYLGRQLYEEMQHVQFYLLLVDAYVSDPDERARMFAAVRTVPSIAAKAAFCSRYTDPMFSIPTLRSTDDKRAFVRCLTAYAAGVEGLFFFAAFAYVYFLRSKGMVPGLATGTNWVFRDESGHMAFAFDVLSVLRQEEPELFDRAFEADVQEMVQAAVAAESAFAADLLSGGVAGLSLGDMQTYLQFIANQRCATLRCRPIFGQVKNPFGFMELQDVQEVANFFERRVSAYQTGIPGAVAFDQDF